MGKGHGGQLPTAARTALRAEGAGGWTRAHLRCPVLPPGSGADLSRHPAPRLCSQPAGLGAGQDCIRGPTVRSACKWRRKAPVLAGRVGGPSLWTLRSTCSVALTSDRPSSDPAIVQLGLWALLFLSVKWEQLHSPCGFAMIVHGASLPGQAPSLRHWPRALPGQSPQPQPW